MILQREKFVEGCAAVNGIKAKQANDIFDLLEKFAGYGFNKSHSAAYGVVAWRTAFLKANYPVEFMAAVLSNEITNTDKISFFVAECQRMGITVLPPDVNRSLLKICFGKGIRRAGTFGGTKAQAGTERPSCPLTRQSHPLRSLCHQKMSASPPWKPLFSNGKTNGRFSSMEDFANRLDGKVVNKKNSREPRQSRRLRLSR